MKNGDTHLRPPPPQWPAEYGVMKLETVPRGFWAQAWMPFRSQKLFSEFVGKNDERS